MHYVLYHVLSYWYPFYAVVRQISIVFHRQYKFMYSVWISYHLLQALKSYLSFSPPPPPPPAPPPTTTNKHTTKHSVVIEHSSSMWLTDWAFIQMHVTFCEYVVLLVLWLSLYITLDKYLGQESITGLFFWSCWYTVCSSTEEISWDDNSMLLSDLSASFSIAVCWTNLSDILFQRRPKWDIGKQPN